MDDIADDTDGIPDDTDDIPDGTDGSADMGVYKRQKDPSPNVNAGPSIGGTAVLLLLTDGQTQTQTDKQTSQ